jgi:hypothetical protein
MRQPETATRSLDWVELSQHEHKREKGREKRKEKKRGKKKERKEERKKTTTGFEPTTSPSLTHLNSDQTSPASKSHNLKRAP